MQFLILILEKITPDLRKLLVNFIKDTLEVYAKKTPNPYDDILVYFLKKILAINE